VKDPTDLCSESVIIKCRRGVHAHINGPSARCGYMTVRPPLRLWLYAVQRESTVALGGLRLGGQRQAVPEDDEARPGDERREDGQSEIDVLAARRREGRRDSL